MKTKIESMFESAYNFINCEEECYYLKQDVIDYLLDKRDFPHRFEFYKFYFAGYGKSDKCSPFAGKFDIEINLYQGERVNINKVIGESELDFYIKEVKAKMEENMAEITNKT